MKKNAIIILFILLLSINVYSLIEKNQYNDVGLNEKNGTFGFDPYLRKSYGMFFTGVGTDILEKFDRHGLDATGDYTEIGFKINMYFQPPELFGFYFNGNIAISRNTMSIFSSGDKSWWNSYMPYFGDTQLGYKHKYFTVQLGFLRLNSSDAIYNHLLIDDYSGSLFGLRLTSMLSRFVDIELIYSMVRPHMGPWWSGNSEITLNAIQDDETLYAAYYGKSLYTHKINIRPLPWIRVGVYEGAYFLGENLNPWYANPFFIYIGSQAFSNVIEESAGSRTNTHAVNLLAGVDFNIGFHGWRVYGEFFLDDSNGEYFKFQKPSHPDKFAFIIGGELRWYLFTRHFKLKPLANFILSNMYINCEYGIVSKYTYSRDSNFNYEYVRNEYKYRYYDNPPDDEEVRSTNRIGNFLGFMYGPNSDSIDFAIGWRSDLVNVREYTAGYQADIYFDSQKEKKIPNRLVKFQIHFRNYRLGDERDVIMPYYWNQHPSYDLETGGVKKGKYYGTSRGTEFLTRVLEIGDILDFEAYGDIVKFSRFVLGLETKFHFQWNTYFPFTDWQRTIFTFRWDFGTIISW